MKERKIIISIALSFFVLALLLAFLLIPQAKKGTLKSTLADDDEYASDELDYSDDVLSED